MTVTRKRRLGALETRSGCSMRMRGVVPLSLSTEGVEVTGLQLGWSRRVQDSSRAKETVPAAAVG